MHNPPSFFFRQIQLSIKSTFRTKSTFFFQAGQIFLSNLLFFFLWKIFFMAFHRIGEWVFQDMLLLMVITFGAFGLMQIFLGGTKKIAYLILSKDLDLFLLRPCNPLLSILLSTSSPKGWGHLASSLFFWSIGGFSPFFLTLVCLISSCLLFATIHILLYSLPFWFGQIEELLRKYEESLLLFSLYPIHIYSKTVQLLLFSLVPAGLIGCFPLELIRHFSYTRLFLLILITGASVSFGFFLFSRGLKKYKQGRALTR